jgi:CheY-like chemotaxis protein
MSPHPILIVDDNESNLKLMKAVLDSDDYVVKTALDAEEAIKVLETFEPRLILMDIQLPGMDGLAFTRLLKRDPARRQITILALTAYAMKGDEDKAIAAGCDGYITKPIDTRTLIKLIDTHLERSYSSPESGLNSRSRIL